MVVTPQTTTHAMSRIIVDDASSNDALLHTHAAPGGARAPAASMVKPNFRCVQTIGRFGVGDVRA
jgi:hypothetical protein